MRRIRSIAEGVAKYEEIVLKHHFTMVAKGDVKMPGGETVATVRVAEKSRMNSFDMLYAIENTDGVLVGRGKSVAISSNQRIDEAMSHALSMLIARREARVAMRAGRVQ
tara:strand:- start:440 stop:766 length:327 start_codon:yes stop_codon:yes gene_type:complete